MSNKRPIPKQSSEAVAQKAQQQNAKAFSYPPQGFQTPIEHTLIHTMIRETSIFPAEAVLDAIAKEDFVQYFFVNEDNKNKQKRAALDSVENDDNTNSNISNSPTTTTTTTHPSNISYAQLTALLALAGEEWAESTKVPEKICQCISKQIVNYANRHNFDRQQELQDLIEPLLEYARKARRKQSLQLLPWFAAVAVSVVNPLAFYTTYMAMIAVNGEVMAKRDMSDRNTLDIVDLSNRRANVEKSSLLDEDYNNEEQLQDD
ncbi:hypothetical protein IV203_023859 [Nitzschia inconspicua]|uniref:Uncharacterized protein n=1 Tax=Nitzschia inconspicua TaxID=303405 RepID=A0A9K3PB41_9STRA|nr:hypothetical protein IV203_023859 [Nitzschia inconspicua]